MPLRLIQRNILAHPLRSLLTFGSVVVAVFLLCVLRATVAGLATSVEESAPNRLWVQSAVSLYVELPLSYESKIAAVDGVEMVTKYQWFGGEYRDEAGFFSQFGVDPDTFLKSYPELEIIDGSYEDFVRTRTGCIIGEDLAASYGWRIGDLVPIIGRIFPRLDGSAWEFTVNAIYRANTTALEPNTLFFHFDYLRESIESGEVPGELAVGVYLVVIAPGRDPTQVMADADALFENGPQRVQTTTEAEFNRQFISMLGNVPALLSSIGGAVLFAIFFAVLNTMLMAGRERIRDVGIMKALGYTDRAVFGTLLLESITLCGAGGLVGVVVALGAESPISGFLAGRVPGFGIDMPTIGMGLGIALGIGILSGTAPGLLASRLSPVRALRMVG